MPDPADPTGAVAEQPQRPRPARWGVRTLWWLGLVFVCMLSANALYSLGVDYWGLLPLAGTIVGICGATYCSYRGLRSATWLGR